MAMITCPECGNMVSDKANSCIHCGSPLQVNKSVKVKIPYFRTGMMGNKACAVELCVGNKSLWTGFSGGVASFEIEEKTVSVSLTIKKAYTGGLSFVDFTIEGAVEQGKKYEVKMVNNAFLGNPAKATWMLSEVDVIDSGI